MLISSAVPPAAPLRVIASATATEYGESARLPSALASSAVETAGQPVHGRDDGVDVVG